jgi:hypothetical protein
MELAEAGPLGKPLHGNGSRRSFFIFKVAIEKDVINTAYQPMGYI